MANNKATSRTEVEKQNKKLIDGYIQYRKSFNNIVEETENTIRSHLTVFENSVKKPLNFRDDITEEDIIHHLERYILRSKAPIISCIKAFARWRHKLENDDKLPKCLRRINPPSKKQLMKIQDPTSPHKTLSQAEIDLIINEGSSNVMDKALIETLSLFGCRPSELLSMNIEHVKEDTENGITSIIVPHSKTIPREIPTNKNPIYLLDWLNVYHRHKNDPDFPLWLSRAPRNLDGRLTVSGLNKIIKRMVKNAKIDKRIYPYMFRHSAITKDRKEDMYTTDLESKYGWKHGTQMLPTYDHNGIENLKEHLIKNIQNKPETYASLKKQKDKITILEEKNEKYEKEIKQLETAFKITIDHFVNIELTRFDSKSTKPSLFDKLKKAGIEIE